MIKIKTDEEVIMDDVHFLLKQIVEYGLIVGESQDYPNISQIEEISNRYGSPLKLTSIKSSDCVGKYSTYKMTFK